MVVREPCLNRAYVDPAIRLGECPDPDAGKKKRARMLEELEVPGPISVVPLRAVGASGPGGPGCAREEATERPLKKAS